VNLQKTFNSFPFLIVSPTSVCQNWLREFAKWAPSLQCALYAGSQAERETITEYELFNKFIPKGNSKFPIPIKNHVIITSFSILARDKSVLGKIPWEVVVVDEAHRLKGNGNQLSSILAAVRTKFKLILTGTPMQNNIRELFNVMRYIAPDTFRDTDKLEEQFKDISQDPAKVSELHSLVRPYVLRRTKKDVREFYSIPPKAEIVIPVVMTQFQASIYKLLVEKNKNMLLSKLGSSAKKVSFLNLMMELRKCANHPLLCTTKNVSELSNESEWTADDIVKASGKLSFVLRILPVLFDKGHRVLLFCGMTRLLDIIEDVLSQKEILHLRIDGNTPADQRQKLVNAFNEPESKYKVFLLSTRAGGLGINLQSADSIIMYDSDFNPHQDLQAFSRAHRFGQEKNVVIYKLLTLNSVEEKIAQIANKKLLLDHVVVERMKDENGYIEDLKNENLFDILSCGLEGLFKSESADRQQVPTTYDDEMIEELTDFPALIAKYQANEDQETPESGILKDGFKFAKIWETASSISAKSCLIDSESGNANATPAEDVQESEDYFWSKILKSCNDSTTEQTQEYGIGKRKRKQIDLSNSIPTEDISQSTSKKGKEDELFEPENDEEESEDSSLEQEFKTHQEQKKPIEFTREISLIFPELIIDYKAAGLDIALLINNSAYTKNSSKILLKNLQRIQLLTHPITIAPLSSSLGFCWFVLSYAKLGQDEGYLALKLSVESLFCNVIFISNKDLEALKAIIRQEAFFSQILLERFKLVPSATTATAPVKKSEFVIPHHYPSSSSSFKIRELFQEDVSENIAKSPHSNSAANNSGYKIFNLTNDDLEMIEMIDQDFIGISSSASKANSNGGKPVEKQHPTIQSNSAGAAPTPQQVIEKVKKEAIERQVANTKAPTTNSPYEQDQSPSNAKFTETPSNKPTSSCMAQPSKNSSPTAGSISITPLSPSTIKNAFSPLLGKKVQSSLVNQHGIHNGQEKEMVKAQIEDAFASSKPKSEGVDAPRGHSTTSSAQNQPHLAPKVQITPVPSGAKSPQPQISQSSLQATTTAKQPQILSVQITQPLKPNASSCSASFSSQDAKRKKIYSDSKTPPLPCINNEIQSTLDTFSMEDLLENLERRLFTLKSSYSQIISQSAGSAASPNEQELLNLQNHLLRTQNAALKAKVEREKKRSVLSSMQTPAPKESETIWKCQWEGCTSGNAGNFSSREALIRHAVSKHL
jgi:hypothetical protein